MGGGGGGNPLDQLTSGLNSAVKFVSGYDPSSGSWSTHGSQFQALDEGLGAIDGRNASRAALNQSQDQFNIAQQQAQDLINQNNWNKQSADATASSSAGAAAATAKITGGINPTNATPLAMGSGGAPAAPKDFLGL
jgi:hypothetical protein